MSRSALGRFTVPCCLALIAFLAYGSQVLFYSLEPGPLSLKEFGVFNVLVLCIIFCYLRSCFTNPGWVPKDWKAPDQDPQEGLTPKTRWCKKCEAHKPPRAHHCKACARCIPKMDHHCPWTTSCVSYRITPHFIRFLFYSVSGMLYLGFFLFERVSLIWERRNLPSVSTHFTTLSLDR